MLAFEAFMANNIQFFDIDDCFNYLNKIKNEKYEMDESLLPPVSHDMLYNRIVSMFHEWNPNDELLLGDYILALDMKSIKRIYYKNNLYEFSDIPFIHNLIYKILKNVDEFKDPNNIPDEIKDDLETLWSYIKQFVFCDYFQFGRIKRLKAFKRKAVVTVDTDSNMICLQPWVDYCKETIIDLDDKLTSRDWNSLWFACINMMAYLLTNVVTETLARYTEIVNIPLDIRPKINMKNEFLFSRIILTDKKKRYGSSVRLREGQEIYPEKIDVKGADFKKSSARKDTKEYFTKLLKEEMLQPYNINVPRVLRKIENFENIIRESLQAGEKDYLIPKNPKEIGSYADPYSQQGIRAVLLWNAIYPSNSIQLPEKIDMVKLKLNTDAELEVLKEKYPDIYDIIDKNVLKHPNASYAEKKAGVIAIPSNVKDIPQWILEFTDTDTIVADNTSKFNSFLCSLDIEIIQTSKGDHFSNIIRI